MTTQVSPVVRNEADRAVSTIVGAFVDDPFVRWFFDDVHIYLNYMPRMVKAMAGKAFDGGTAWQADGFAGVALWLTPEDEPDFEAMGEISEAAIAPDRLKALGSIQEQMTAHHPHDAWFLPLIGVDPTRKGRGTGSTLLTHTLALCDQEGQAAYLESTNPRNNPLYERFGFEVIGLIQAEESPPMWPMLRRPRPPGTSR